MALAHAINRLHEHPGPLAGFMAGAGATLDILEINEAGGLTPLLSRSSGHVLARYPAVDIHALPMSDGSFDLVVHSDTLEHVAEPRAALAECRRVLRTGGACAFTVPIVVDRLTASRAGLEPSFHGDPSRPEEAMLVRTEYGADAWKDVLLGGFSECRIVSLEYPAALALVGVT